MRRRLVFPAPFSPSTNSRSSLPRSKLTSSKIAGPPYDFVRPSATRTVRPLCGGSGNRNPDALLPRRPLDPLRLQLRYTGVERLGLPSPFCGLSAHRVGEGPKPLDLVPLPFGELAEPDLVEAPGLSILAVGAPVLDDTVATQMQDPRDRRIQERQVVTHHDQRTLVRREE